MSLLLLAIASPAAGGERYAVVISGASAGAVYATKYDGWREGFVRTLRERFGYPGDHLFVFGEHAAPGTLVANRENIGRTFAALRATLNPGDDLFVVLIGHGTSADGENGKFNLVGPDLNVGEWADLLRPLGATVSFIDTTGASFPFLRGLASRGRIVVTATDSAGQQFDTVFPDYFFKAFDDAAADADKNGRVSLWEAFAYASAGVARWFDEHGRLPTERPLLDDTGAGIGRQATTPGLDGSIAKATYLEPENSPAQAVDSSAAALVRKRAELEKALEELKLRKGEIPAAEYDAALERLLLELTRIAQELKSKS